MNGTTKSKLQWTSTKLDELAQEIDPRLSIHPQVEEFLMELADEFLENVGSFAAQLAKHRRSNVVEAKDIQFCLKKNWNIHIHGLSASDASSSSTQSRKKETAQDVIKPKVNKGRLSLHGQRLELVTKARQTQQQQSQPQHPSPRKKSKKTPNSNSTSSQQQSKKPRTDKS